MDDKIIQALTDHAEQCFPEECCGLVVDNGGVLLYVPCDNQSPTPLQSFLIDPRVYLKWVDRLVFVAHSHPNRSAAPSQADKGSCERANVPFLILSYPTGEIQCYSPCGYQPDVIGRPFVYGIFDCLSLVRDFYQVERDVVLDDVQRPAFGWWHQIENLNVTHNHFKHWGFKAVDSPKHGDVVVMQLQASVPNHVAVFQQGGLILHQTVNNIGRLEQYGNYWRKNTVSFWRLDEND